MIDIEKASIEEVKQFAKDELDLRIAHNASEEKIREKVSKHILEQKTEAKPEAETEAETEAKPEGRKAIMDKSKPYGTVRGEPGVCFYQNGKMFDSKGEEA